jgi:hypothetical protein
MSNNNVKKDKNNQDNNCDCFRCREAKDKMKIVQRENTFLGNIITFSQ